MNSTVLNPFLHPVIYTVSPFRRRNIHQRMRRVILLREIDLGRLKKAVGERIVAGVNQRLDGDRSAMRKDYYGALVNAGLTLDFIAKGLYKIAKNADKDTDRLNAFKIVLKSLGLENFNAVETSPLAGTWEEELVRSLESQKGKNLSMMEAEYKVVVPETPESAKKVRREEEKITRGIYG